LSYDSSGKKTRRQDGKHRIRQVLKALHTLTTELWAGRNTALHEASNMTSGPLSLIDAEIVQYHREPELMLTDDRFYCEKSLHRLLASGASIKRRWLHRVKRSRAKKAQLEKDQPRITKYFRTETRTEDTQKIHHKGRPPDAINTQASIAPSRSTTTQRLMTYFLHERASNHKIHSPTESPLPSDAPRK
jgi:hypothetical protein